MQGTRRPPVGAWESASRARFHLLFPGLLALAAVIPVLLHREPGAADWDDFLRAAGITFLVAAPGYAVSVSRGPMMIRDPEKRAAMQVRNIVLGAGVAVATGIVLAVKGQSLERLVTQPVLFGVLSGGSAGCAVGMCTTWLRNHLRGTWPPDWE